MKKIASLLFFISIVILSLPKDSFSQTEKLNQFDVKGKKDGKWKVYMNERWKVVKDSSAAVYYWYTWFDHGQDVIQFHYKFKHGLKLDPVGNNIQKGKSELLDGEYKWKYKNGIIRIDFVLKKGEFVSEKGFYKTGEPSYYCDHTKKWKGQPHTYRWTNYSKDGKMSISYQRCEEGYWMAWGFGRGGINWDSIKVDTLKIVGDSAFVNSAYFSNGKLGAKGDEILIHVSDLRTKTIQNGNFTSYYPDGQKKWEGQYSSDLKEAIIRSYYPNGQQKEEGAFSKEKKIGEWKWWDQDGKLAKTKNYK